MPPIFQESDALRFGNTALLIDLNMSCSTYTEPCGKSSPCENWAFLSLFLACMFWYSHCRVLVGPAAGAPYPQHWHEPTGAGVECKSGTCFLIVSWHEAELMKVMGLMAALEESIADLRRSQWPRAAITKPGLSNLRRGVSASFSFYGQNPEVFIQSLSALAHVPKQATVIGIK